MFSSQYLADRDWYMAELYIAWRAAGAEADAPFGNRLDAGSQPTSSLKP